MLIEALVALVVVGVGTFGVVKLNAVMLKGTGESKTRAEAMQLAQQRIEDLRNFSVEAGCPAAETSTEANAVTRTNASYKIGRTISNVVSERVDVQIFVGWDGASDPRNSAAATKVVLSTVVACVNVGTSGMIGGNASALNGGTIKTPTGSARVGGRDNPTCPNGSCVTTINNTNSKPDNTKVYTTGNLVELVDTVTNKVLLTVDDGSAFSTISGRVYIEADNSGNAIVDPDGSTANDGTSASIADDNVFVLSSDASYCARIFPTDANSKVPSSASGSGIKYRYFDYNCYVSKGWWGNIGVVRLDNPNTNNRVCVGDLAYPSSETSIWSKKAQLSISRGYRAYRKIDPNGSATEQSNFETVGIGYSLSGGVVSSSYAAVNLGSSADANHHDFLITVITGQGTCESSGKMTLIPGNTASSNQFTSNLGKFYCMSGQCPALAQAAATQTTVVHGTIAKASGAVLTGVDPADCQTTPTFTVAADGNSYSYSCTKVWSGFAGSAWQGGVTFTTPASPTPGYATTLCTNTSGSVATVLPAGNTVASTVNDKAAGVNPNSLSFTDVALAVTDITINFDAKTNCTTLGQPQPSWGTNGSKPYPLSWPVISNANSYKVLSCGPTLGTSCTPVTQSTQTAASYQPANPGLANAICIQVIASDTTGVNADSALSSRKCVSRAASGGGAYTHN